MWARREQLLAGCATPSESVVLLAGLWMIMCAGLQYSFATYSEDLRTTLELSQWQLELLALGKDVGAYTGFVQGAFYDAHGPQRTVAVGAALHALGFGSLWALVGRAGQPGAPRAPLWQPVLCLLVGSNGAGWLDMGVLMTLLHNAGAERSLASGVAKSVLGLGAAVFSCVYVSFLKPNARAYLLLCALAPLCVAVLTVPVLVRLPRPELHLARRSPARAARLWALGCWVALLCAYLLAANAATQGAAPSHAVRVGTTAGLLLLLLLPPVGLTMAGGRSAAPTAAPEHREALLTADDDAGAREPEPSAAAGAPSSPSSGAAAAADAEAPAPGAAPPPKLRGQRSAELTLGACVRTAEFWLMATALTLGGGAALALINNLGQLTAALRSPVGPESFVALLSVCNAAGRLLQGAGAHAALRAGFTPPAMLAAALLVLASTQLALAGASPAGLHACVALTGLCFGSFWSFAPVAVGELFGERHAGVIYGVIGTAPALGSLLLNTLVAGHVYDAHVRATPPPPPGAAPAPRCLGHECFALTFHICGIACMLGAACAYTLERRTRHMYRLKAAA